MPVLLTTYVQAPYADTDEYREVARVGQQLLQKVALSGTCETAAANRKPSFGRSVRNGPRAVARGFPDCQGDEAAMPARTVEKAPQCYALG
jgi:hypothetical protein